MVVRVNRQALVLILVACSMLVLSGCGLIFGRSEPDPTPTSVERALVPTFTPTPPDAAVEQSAADAGQSEQAEENAVDEAVQVEATPAEAIATPVPEVAAEEPTATPEPPTPTPVPKLVVSIPSANVRNGPGTSYGLAGSVSQDQAFDIVGQSPDGTWWKFCCVNGQEVWIFGELVRTENAGTVEVVQDIPEPPPVAQAPAAPPAQEPAPAEPPPAEQPPPESAADPCANIGGDGCKFKVRRGPQFANNGGMELKLQLLFIHSGIDGGQPQGSYFVVMLKDGVKLPIGDEVRSIANNKSQGVLGEYNYEYKVGIDRIPGNTVAGNYTMFVLDGNGERDSRDINFSIPDGQGEVWVEWDQG